MELHLVNFATTHQDVGFPDYAAFQSIQNESAKQWGIQHIRSWTRQQILKTSLYKENKYILDHKIGGGYWLWKPYIILDQLKAVSEGDIVIFMDSDIRFVDDPKPLADICVKSGGFFLVDLRRPDRLNKFWIKRDCFYYMGLDTPDYHNAYQTPSGLVVLQRNSKTLEFVEEWLEYCKDRRILTDEPNTCGLPNLEGFQGHRHDQSILTLLKLKYKIEGYRWPSQWGNYAKLPEYRVEGEFISLPYSKYPYTNSPYGTILSDLMLEGYIEPLEQKPPIGLAALRQKIQRKDSKPSEPSRRPTQSRPPALEIGFHGDQYLLSMVDRLMVDVESFIETGANVGTTARYMAQTYPNVDVYSCEPNLDAFQMSLKTVAGCKNVHMYYMQSPEFFYYLQDNAPELKLSRKMYWLDAHDYGFRWPLYDELRFITSEFSTAIILIDDAQIPGQPQFKYSSYEDQVCNTDYIVAALTPGKTYKICYPIYTERTSPHHPLTGVITVSFGELADRVGEGIEHFTVQTYSG